MLTLYFEFVHEKHFATIVDQMFVRGEWRARFGDIKQIWMIDAILKGMDLLIF